MILNFKIFPNSFFRASSFSTIFKFFLGFNLLIFNKLAFDVIQNQYLSQVIFLIHTMPILISFYTLGMKLSIQRNQLENGKFRVNNISFFIASIINTSVLCFPVFSFIFQEFNISNFINFFFFSLSMVSYQLIISILIGSKKFFLGNFFGGIQLNGFLFGFSLNLILFFISLSNLKLDLNTFLMILNALSAIMLLFSLLTLYFSKIKNKGYIDVKNVFKKGFLIFFKNLSDVASFNLDVIFARIFIGENILYLYTTISSFARVLLMPRQIFAPILIPFIKEAHNKKEVSGFNFLRTIAGYGTLLSLIMFIFFIYLFESAYLFYNIDIELYNLGFEIFILLSISSILKVFLGYAGICLIAISEENTVFKVVSSSLIIFLVLLNTLPQYFGILGICLAVLIFDILTYTLFAYNLKRKHKINSLAKLF